MASRTDTMIFGCLEALGGRVAQKQAKVDSYECRPKGHGIENVGGLHTHIYIYIYIYMYICIYIMYIIHIPGGSYVVPFGVVYDEP